MARLFDISEKPLLGHTPSSGVFVLTSTTPPNYNILRIIMGGVSITNNDVGITCDLTTNYLSLYYAFDELKSPEGNLSEILNDSIELPDLEKFFFDRRYSLKNKDFFNRLENEFCNFLLYQSKENYTTAFIFLYRILEVISFSFPLIYASKTYDFKHTYGKLKEIFSINSGNSTGELGFLKSAIKVMFEGSELLETSIDIDLDDEFEKNEKIYKALKSVIDNKIFHTDTIENSKLSICFGDVSSFIITLRNRFFHLFNRGDKNLESIEIIDPDYLFSKINKPVFTWICVVYLEINKFLLEEHEKYVR